MAKDEDVNDVQADQIADSFLCCICLDLLYKPVVLSCGHMSCFWCVHKSMSGWRVSHCPICREPFHHFPATCEMLYYLLVKMYPIAYKRREEQILQEEKERDCFSPQFDYNHRQQHPIREHDRQAGLACLVRNSECNSFLDICCTSKESEEEPFGDKEQTDSSPFIEVANSVPNMETGISYHVSADDVQCVSCKQLLYRPVVLNCGHVYCQTCIPSAVDERIRCVVCQSLHPGAIPKVCLEFNHFLEGLFQKEYAIKDNSIQAKNAYARNDKSATCSTKDAKFSDPHAKVHLYVGCDSCGMWPIVGDRYKCKDCSESIGYDLCGDCYSTCSKLPGRFNQQHTAGHKFELMGSNTQNSTGRLMSG